MEQITKDLNRLDASETAFFTRQLEHIKSKTYDTKYRNLKAMELIPVDTSAPAGAATITYRRYSQRGVAKIIADYAHDFPRVDVYGEEDTIKVYSIGSSYGYSILEIRRAQMAGQPLEQRRANAARRAIDEKIDKLAWNGDSDYNIQGFINYPGITDYTLTTGASGFLWSVKTPDEIITDLTGLMSAVSIPTKGKEVVDTILLPRTQYNLIKDKRMTDGNDKTVLTFFTSNNPGVSVVAVDELEAAGVSSAQRMMGYVKDSDHLTQEMPQPFEQIAADKVGMEYTIPCHAEHAGVIVYYPQSVVFSDGI